LERAGLDWLAPPPGLRCIDIGCGNGAFTELIVQRCAPAKVQGIYPSQGQLAFARNKFDAAVMARCCSSCANAIKGRVPA
jgi:ubiquinone/menaquinone biosynthesis C-methylase UbiE